MARFDFEKSEHVKTGVLKTLSTTHLRRAFPIHEFCRRYGIGRTTAYAEIAAGRLRAVKAGRRTLISEDAAESWLAALPAQNGKSTGETI
jgi:excisionase family DNA binding protein